MRPLYHNPVFWVFLFGITLIGCYYCPLLPQGFTAQKTKIVSFEEILKRFPLEDEKRILRFRDLLNTSLGMGIDQAEKRLSGFTSHYDEDLQKSYPSICSETPTSLAMRHPPEKEANGVIEYFVCSSDSMRFGDCNKDNSYCIGQLVIKSGRVVSVIFRPIGIPASP